VDYLSDQDNAEQLNQVYDSNRVNRENLSKDTHKNQDDLKESIS
jgi:hypothetical protein